MLKKNRFKLFFIVLGPILCILLCVLVYQGFRHKSTPGSILSGEFPPPEWVFNTTEKIISTPAFDNNGHVYIRTSSSIIALDTQSGRYLWQSEISGDYPLSMSPQVSGDYLAVPTTDSQIAVLSTDTGRLIWISPIVESKFAPKSYINIEAFLINEDLLIVARHYWRLTAYRIADGQVMWEQDISHAANPYMIMHKNVIYLSSGSLLKAYDARNGNILWQKEFSGYLGQMLIIDNSLYVIDEEYSGLIVIDLNSHEVLLRKFYNAYVDDFTIQCFSFVDDSFYISAEGILALSIDGEVTWVKEKTGLLECPVTLKNSLFVRNIGTSLFNLDRESGQELGVLAVQKNTRNKDQPDRSPIVVDNLLIIPVDDYQVVAYHP